MLIYTILQILQELADEELVEILGTDEEIEAYVEERLADMSDDNLYSYKSLN